METGMNADRRKSKETSSSKDSSGLSGWLDDALGQLNTDFPLSGAETEEDFEETDDSNEDVTEREHLDTNFPLSGGSE